MIKLYFKAGTLLDCTGAAPQNNKSLTVEDGIITKIGLLSDPAPSDAKVYDFSCETVMPGLMNAHAHIHGFYPYNDMSDPSILVFDAVERTLYCQKTIHAFLQSGVTFIRSMGSKENFDVRIKRAMNKGLMEKIGMIAAGPYITMTGGHSYQSGIEVDGVDACLKAARLNLKNGSDILKVMATGGILSEGEEVGKPQLSYAELKAVVDVGHSAGKKVATHAQGPLGILNAVRAGVDSVEHGCILSDEIIALMVKKGVFLVPTLCATHTILKNANSGVIPAFGIRKATIVKDQHVMWLKKAYDAGVKIAAGTDSSTPFNPPENSWLEIKLLLESGIGPMDAILAATKNCAELFGVDALYGTLEKDKVADIIVVDENPLVDVETLSRVRKVFKEGMEVK